MGKFIDLTGQKFGRLTVMERAENRNKVTFWLCRCSCGKEKEVCSRSLITGHAKSCGCFKKEWAVTHGQSRNGNKIYQRWFSLKSRYKNNICEEWLKFEPFYEWSIANGYSDKLYLSRITEDDIFKPDNCLWATRSDDINNHRRSFKFEEKTVAQWARYLEVDRNLIYGRLRSGWSPEEAIITPARKKRK